MQEEKEAKAKKKLERDIELELGDDYTLDLKKNYDLKNEDEKYDIIPEIWEGHNIADYVDPDIMKRLEELEREEEELERNGYYDYESEGEDENVKELRGLAKKIRERKAIMKVEQRMNQTNKPKVNRKAKKVFANALNC